VTGPAQDLGMAGGRVPAVTGRCGGSDQACSNTWSGALAAAPGAWCLAVSRLRAGTRRGRADHDGLAAGRRRAQLAESRQPAARRVPL